MHAAERETAILNLLTTQNFIAYRALEAQLPASPATIRRDLARLAAAGRLVRLHGGIKAIAVPEEHHLAGVPFHENIHRHTKEKRAIGKAAAALCQPGEAVMIDGGSTTLQMCPHLSGFHLQVLTNSLHIVSALIGQAGTRVLVPSGAVFPEQNIILPLFGEDGMPQVHAPKLFMGAAAIGEAGLMQADPILVAGERRLVACAQQIIVLVDSSKFEAATGHVVCGLEQIDTVVTDAGISPVTRAMLSAAKVDVHIAS